MSANIHSVKDVRPVIQQLLNDFELAVHLIDKARSGKLTQLNYELALQLVSDVRKQIHHLNIVVPEQCELPITQDGIPILLDTAGGSVH